MSLNIYPRVKYFIKLIIYPEIKLDLRSISSDVQYNTT